MSRRVSKPKISEVSFESPAIEDNVNDLEPIVGYTTDEKVEPVKVESIQVESVNIPQLPPGKVWVVALDKEGKEKPKSGFMISERGFNKHYNTENFKIKKK